MAAPSQQHHQPTNSMYTLKVNIRAQEERERRERERKHREALSKIKATLGPAAPPRKRKGLNFNEPGIYIARGEQLRKKAKLEALQKKIAEKAARTGVQDAARLAALTTNKLAAVQPASRTASDDQQLTTSSAVTLEEEAIPEIEWWDKPLLRNGSMADVVIKLQQGDLKPEDAFCGITNLVQHPPAPRAPKADLTTVQIPEFLTKKEFKKIRKINRKNAELEKQEKIKLGLLPKPEPKLKRSNIMHTLGNEAIVNPSAAEQMVKDQEDKRQKAHLEHNESKKLTYEEKKAKKLRKIQEDLNVVGTWVSVFRILNLDSQANKFKVIQNAKQLTMTGVLILYKDINLVVVEGGPKQQRKYKHLMLNRIDWASEPSLTENGPKNRCLLVWEGQVPQRSFQSFRVKQMKDADETRAFFKQFKVEHYWDLAFKMTILESIAD